MSEPDSDVLRAYRALLDEADRLHQAIASRLDEVRAADTIDADEVSRLEGRLARTTELIDLLESAVAIAVPGATQPTS